MNQNFCFFKVSTKKHFQRAHIAAVWRTRKLIYLKTSKNILKIFLKKTIETKLFEFKNKPLQNLFLPGGEHVFGNNKEFAIRLMCFVIISLSVIKWKGPAKSYRFLAKKICGNAPNLDSYETLCV